MSGARFELWPSRGAVGEAFGRTGAKARQSLGLEPTLRPSRRVRRGSASCQRKLCDPHWIHAETCRVRRHAEDDPTGAAMDGIKPNHTLRCAPAQRIAGAHAVLCAVRPFPRCKATQQSALPHLSHARSTSAACCAIAAYRVYATCDAVARGAELWPRCTLRGVSPHPAAEHPAVASAEANHRHTRVRVGPAEPECADQRRIVSCRLPEKIGRDRYNQPSGWRSGAPCPMRTCSVVRKRLQSDSSSWTTGMLVPRGT